MYRSADVTPNQLPQFGNHYDMSGQVWAAPAMLGRLSQYRPAWGTGFILWVPSDPGPRGYCLVPPFNNPPDRVTILPQKRQICPLVKRHIHSTQPPVLRPYRLLAGVDFRLRIQTNHNGMAQILFSTPQNPVGNRPDWSIIRPIHSTEPPVVTPIPGTAPPFIYGSEKLTTAWHQSHVSTPQVDDLVGWGGTKAQSALRK
ncbi:uncharacterized protein MELLADRAFT_108219 [Melampsora larici-populina 98AG31]|uniref:Uncharacterized protein n=1 Tax=Melampsora larici-populina (strain 98AG31 / pathotype 3-4-7) TaxID=747676 RepID=F4RSD0_MELLP|nr:uncharacterized protein MELLADRAFT_108219 [Melampsora larici-populina 98AG31]EGG04714.1 hypothetical protein MELLADRAFT_108219 [Melampsora larici-populina 98AG31]